MDVHNRPPCVGIRQGEHELAIEPPGAAEGGVDRVGAVSGADNDHLTARVETVHEGEEGGDDGGVDLVLLDASDCGWGGGSGSQVVLDDFEEIDGVRKRHENFIGEQLCLGDLGDRVALTWGEAIQFVEEDDGWLVPLGLLEQQPQLSLPLAHPLGQTVRPLAHEKGHFSSPLSGIN